MKSYLNTKTRLTAASITTVIVLSVALGVGLPVAGASAAAVSVKSAKAAAPTFQSAPQPIKVTTAAVAQPQIKVALKERTPIQSAAASTSTQKATKTAKTAAYVASTGELSEAKAILAGLIAKYPVLKGATVSFGDAQGYQAICYYKSGRIVLSSSHTASLSRILNHEVWHIIDWRDNGRIDWGENVPPSN